MYPHKFFKEVWCGMAVSKHCFLSLEFLWKLVVVQSEGIVVDPEETEQGISMLKDSWYLTL